jgi:hypothetical protein
MPKDHKTKKGGKGGRSHPFRDAPKQGIGSTEDWIINDVQILTAPSTTTGGAFTCRFSADANGLAWNVSDSGTTVAQYPTAAYF